MGITKSEIFTPAQNELASLSKALGHPARIAIIEYLSSLNACVCGEIVDHLGLAQSTVSQHLKELKKVGLIKGSIEGTSICYCLNIERWEECKSMFDQLFGQAITINNCC